MLQVGTDARFYGHNGKRVYLKGVHMLQSTFSMIGDGYRLNWARRYSQGGGGGGSPGTYCAPIHSSPQSWLSQTYVDDATFYAKLVDLKKYQFNAIRFYVDQGFYQTGPFTDDVTLTDFPSEPDIVAKIIQFCSELGMFVIIAYAYCSTPDSDAIDFWSWVADYYKDTDNVIFEVQSEAGATNQRLYTASFAGSISGTTLTVSSVYGGTIGLGNKLSGAVVDPATVVNSQTSGTTGGAGVYVVSVSQTVASETIESYRPASDAYDFSNWTNTVTPTSTGISAYNSRIGGMVTAIRDAGFKGVIAIPPMCNLWNVGVIAPCITDPDQPFLDDPNLAIGIHTYYFYGDTPTDFSVTLPGLTSGVTNYARDWAILNTEFGFTNNPYGSSTPPYSTQAATDAALAWDSQCASWSMKEHINGAVFFCMQPGQPDDYNDIFDATTGYITDWGGAITSHSTFADSHLATFNPTVTAMTGSLTDGTATIMKWRRDGNRVDCRLVLKITTNGTAAGVLLVELPARAPCNGHQKFTGFKSNGTAVSIDVIGEYAEITNYDGTYPGADGLTVYADFAYYCESSGFNYDTMVYANDHWLTRTTNLTGIADGKAGTVAFTLDMTGGDGTQMRIFTTSNSRCSILRNTGNHVQVQLRNTSNTIIGTCVADITSAAADGKQTFLIGWNLATPTILMYINGVSHGSSTGYVATNDTIDYTDSDFSVGALVAGGEKLQGNMDFLWFDDSYLAPSTASNLALFYDYKNNPIDLGRLGDRPINKLPKVYLRQLDSVASQYVNNGSGGGFTKH